MTGPSDTTGRERILDAAMTAFAEQGDAASIRGIAKAAGCSPALVQHHFGTKQNLRDSCDEHLLDYFRRHVSLGMNDLQVADSDFLAEVHRTSPVIVKYLRRQLVDDSPQARALFNALVDLTEPYLVADATGASSPARDRAAVLVGMKLGLLVLRDQVERALEIGALPAAMHRIEAAEVDLLHPGLGSLEIMAAAHRATARPSE